MNFLNPGFFRYRYVSELLKHTKYFHTMPERFFTFRIHAQSVGMAVMGNWSYAGSVGMDPYS